MPYFNPVQVGPAIGPAYYPNTSEQRDKYSHALSETCSLTDQVFQGKTGQQKLNTQLPLGEKPIGYFYSNPCPVPFLPTPQAVIAEYREMIQEHVERRVSFFFQQLLCCNRTNLHFESVTAQDQGESATPINMNVNTVVQKYVKRQAAHSGSNPCLIAYDNNQWSRYEAGLIPKPQGFVYLKDTDYYRTMNATMEMPIWFNDADREIDEKTRYSLLREKGEAILNRAAQGFITPDEGMVEYIQSALFEVYAGRVRLWESRQHPEVQEVLSYYEKYLLEIRQMIQSDPLFLEKFLNIKLGSATQDERSKRVILQIRYAAVRNCQINQSGLIQRIQHLKEWVLWNVKAANRGRQPNNFDAAFNTLLVGCARTDQDRKRVEKLLNFSPINFEAQIQGGARTKYMNTKARISTFYADIDFVVREILQDMRTLRVEEMYQRGQTIRELRHMKVWTQKRLGEEVKRLFPRAAASQGTISRIESQGKLVTEQIAHEFSRIFGVDPGLFMPSFYYD